MDTRPNCPYCGSKRVISKHPQFRCKDCRRAWLKEGQAVTRQPKILLFDIETSPMMVLVWGLYKQKIPPQNIVKEWSILSWAAKWLCDSKIMSEVVTPEAAIAREDKQIVNGIWELLNEADIVIAHNGLKFDQRKINARFKVNGLNPPMPYQVIDTMLHAKKQMAFSNYSLNYLNSLFEKTKKFKTEYGLWKRCIGLNVSSTKQRQALAQMVKYNRQDIVALEDLFLELRPWLKGSPNLSTYYNDSNVSRCPNCGGTELKWEGFYHTPAGRFKTFRCACGAIGRSRFSDLSAEEKRFLTTPIAR